MLATAGAIYFTDLIPTLHLQIQQLSLSVDKHIVLSESEYCRRPEIMDLFAVLG